MVMTTPRVRKNTTRARTVPRTRTTVLPSVAVVSPPIVPPKEADPVAAATAATSSSNHHKSGSLTQHWHCTGGGDGWWSSKRTTTTIRTQQTDPCHNTNHYYDKTVRTLFGHAPVGAAGRPCPPNRGRGRGRRRQLVRLGLLLFLVLAVLLVVGNGGWYDGASQSLDIKIRGTTTTTTSDSQDPSRPDSLGSYQCQYHHHHHVLHVPLTLPSVGRSPAVAQTRLHLWKTMAWSSFVHQTALVLAFPKNKNKNYHKENHTTNNDNHTNHHNDTEPPRWFHTYIVWIRVDKDKDENEQEVRETLQAVQTWFTNVVSSSSSSSFNHDKNNDTNDTERSLLDHPSLRVLVQRARDPFLFQSPPPRTRTRTTSHESVPHHQDILLDTDLWGSSQRNAPTTTTTTTTTTRTTHKKEDCRIQYGLELHTTWQASHAMSTVVLETLQQQAQVQFQEAVWQDKEDSHGRFRSKPKKTSLFWHVWCPPSSSPRQQQQQAALLEWHAPPWPNKNQKRQNTRSALYNEMNEDPSKYPRGMLFAPPTTTTNNHHHHHHHHHHHPYGCDLEESGVTVAHAWRRREVVAVEKDEANANNDDNKESIIPVSFSSFSSRRSGGTTSPTVSYTLQHASDSFVWWWSHTNHKQPKQNKGYDDTPSSSFQPPMRMLLLQLVERPSLVEPRRRRTTTRNGPENDDIKDELVSPAWWSGGWQDWIPFSTNRTRSTTTTMMELPFCDSAIPRSSASSHVPVSSSSSSSMWSMVHVWWQRATTAMMSVSWSSWTTIMAGLVPSTSHPSGSSPFTCWEYWSIEGWTQEEYSILHAVTPALDDWTRVGMVQVVEPPDTTPNDHGVDDERMVRNDKKDNKGRMRSQLPVGSSGITISAGWKPFQNALFASLPHRFGISPRALKRQVQPWVWSIQSNGYNATLIQQQVQRFRQQQQQQQKQEEANCAGVDPFRLPPVGRPWTTTITTTANTENNDNDWFLSTWIQSGWSRWFSKQQQPPQEESPACQGPHWDTVLQLWQDVVVEQLPPPQQQRQDKGPRTTPLRVPSPHPLVGPYDAATNHTFALSNMNATTTTATVILQNSTNHAKTAQTGAHSPLLPKPTTQQDMTKMRTRSVTTTTTTTTTWNNKYNLVHVVHTRFMQHQPNLLHLGRARLELFRTFTVPSMRQQTNGQYLWIIWTDPDLHPTLLDELIQILEFAAQTNHGHNDTVTMAPTVIVGATHVVQENFRQGMNGLLRQPHKMKKKKNVEQQQIDQSTVNHFLLYGSAQVLLSYYEAAQHRVLLETRLDADDALAHSFIELIQGQARHSLGDVYGHYSVHSRSQHHAVRVWCINHYVDWRYYNPHQEQALFESSSVMPLSSSSSSGSSNKEPFLRGGSNSMSPVSVDASLDERGGWLSREQDMQGCVTVGMTMGFQVKAGMEALPTKEHHRIRQALPSCPADNNNDGSSNPNIPNKIHSCVRGLEAPPKSKATHEDPSFQATGEKPDQQTQYLALRARTPTSTSMINVVSSSGSSIPFSHNGLIKNQSNNNKDQILLWQALERDFGIGQDMVHSLRNDFEGNLSDILLDAIAGLCQAGHSCRSSSKALLMHLLWMQRGGRPATTTP